MIKHIKRSVKDLLGLGKSEREESFGAWGETIAARFLRKKGYRIIERNFQSFAGEIDIIAGEGNVTVFVEVKTRSSTIFGQPEEAVNETKFTHMKRAANAYLKSRKVQRTDEPHRFDVISIFADRKTRVVKSIKLFKNINV
jgi:putative endonuclease